MPVDRILYTRHITKDEAPAWLCPTCGAGHFRLDSQSLNTSWASESEQARSEEWFGAEHVELRFVALFKCDNEKCKEAASLAGRGEVQELHEDHMEDVKYVEVLFPTYVNPSPLLITLPLRCPNSVTEELIKSFTASWGDFPSAGNHIRTATELLLDSLRINKTAPIKNKTKRHSLTLHERIETIKTKHPNVHEHLLAIKWLGNAGSHSASLTRDSVFDALDIFESVLEELYSNHPKNIKQLVTAVNLRKGPVRKRTQA